MNAPKPTARETILAAIRAANVPPSPPARVVDRRAEAPDVVPQFLLMLSAVSAIGALCEPPNTVDSLVDGWFPTSRDGVLIVRGHCAVAENGAVYVNASDLESRTRVVSAEHVVVVVKRDTIVGTMDEAVGHLRGDGCEWFLSGPSKTADIEQSLVIGAQGSRSMHVIIEA